MTLNDENEHRVGFFRGLWAVGRGLARAIGKVLSGGRRLFSFGARRVRHNSDDAPDTT
jgi:hypothetical protein